MCFRKRQRDQAEHVKMVRLEQAEGDLRDLQTRADRALRTLDERHRRNHWRESIEQMIQGAPHA